MSLTIKGVIVLLLSQVLPLEEVEPVINALTLVISTLMIWYGRYRQGDITWYGKKL